MKYFFTSLFLFTLLSCDRAQAPVSTTPSPQPVSDECILLAEISDPKHKDEFPIQFCMYTHTEARGIFAATACVGVLIESQSGTRHPFYGDHGHWGIEGNCESQKIIDKFNEHETSSTLNPITDLKNKRKQGKQIKILRDDLDVAKTLVTVTKP